MFSDVDIRGLAAIVYYSTLIIHYVTVYSHHIPLLMHDNKLLLLHSWFIIDNINSIS